MRKKEGGRKREKEGERARKNEGERERESHHVPKEEVTCCIAEIFCGNYIL